MDVEYPILTCSKCILRLRLEKSDLEVKDLFLKEEQGRKIFFAPVGNQFNFGNFAGRHTPKVIIMGITTSPSARINFLKNFIRLKRIYKLADVLKYSCILNIFNSDSPTLQRRLSQILNLTGVPKIVGWMGDLLISRYLFNEYIENPANEKLFNLMNGIYFTQVIYCASCQGENGRSAPKFEDLKEFQIGCINSQLDFMNSFAETVELLITFGKVGSFFEKLGKSQVINAICKHHVNIPHPASALGWNYLPMMNLPFKEFKTRVLDRLSGENYSGFRKHIENCYHKLVNINSIVKEILKGNTPNSKKRRVR